MSEKKYPTEKAESFLEWMFLEAKASRAGLTVDPLIEETALSIEKRFAAMYEDIARILNDVELEEKGE